MLLSIKLPKEQKMEIVRNVQAYFEGERSEQLGDLGAEQLIDFMIGELGPYIYNKAIEDARQLVLEKMNQIEDEFYSLEKPVGNRKR
ncbi:DUF2164 domain-containing protein [Paenibacillus nanensis]|uniref:DUF2164 domain-containing protein n=1 Tax=Paenibacillus nanensis TaxID=393251 RepID=A0A3A1UZI5_9BACL|nr:DUF2164 domain-containing protein [Paenibacillus nanensis]RIX53675.1 DUF2164 domain-containing protein [Paenibacillus nanensis]